MIITLCLCCIPALTNLCVDHKIPVPVYAIMGTDACYKPGYNPPLEPSKAAFSPDSSADDSMTGRATPESAGDTTTEESEVEEPVVTGSNERAADNRDFSPLMMSTPVRGVEPRPTLVPGAPREAARGTRVPQRSENGGSGATLLTQPQRRENGGSAATVLTVTWNEQSNHTHISVSDGRTVNVGSVNNSSVRPNSPNA